MKTNHDMLFHEIFSSYYRFLTKITNTGPINNAQLQEILQECCYDESSLFFSDLLESCDFIKQNDEKQWKSIFEKKINQPLSKLEKSWLKAVIADPKLRLFVDNDVIDKLQTCLEDVTPLFNYSDFHTIDMIDDSEEYSSEEYIKLFRQLNKVIDEKQTITMSYENISGIPYPVTCIPLKLEYSPKSNKFRMLSIAIRDGKPTYLACHSLIRIKGIIKAEPTKFEVNRNPYAEEFYFEPIEVKINNNRGAVMRFLIEFSTYKKESIIDSETGDCVAKIFYHLAEESEIITKILSLSPNIKVLSPERTIEKIKSLLIQQQNLLIQNQS